ncbi:MAG: pyridoxamine 5'-phosphate oxidase family protein [Lentisphaeria bacterium]|nr:pyridoxamine 5'-phosphate oxidase family protein [Lentisphaeria bacterium]
MIRDLQKTVGALIDKCSIAQLCYLDKDGFPVTRAMLQPRERHDLREFYFTTNTSSEKVSALRNNPKASIYFVDRRFFRGVSLAGIAEILEDAATKERIWRDGDEQYYSKGVTDPDYCVIKITVQKIRYYSNFKSTDFSVL